MIGIVLIVLVGASLGFLIIRQRQASTQVEREWQAAQVMPIDDLGATHSLEIIPLVDELASGSEFQTEHGVSYLIKTDHATILFDVGQNTNATDPSPLQANTRLLGISPNDVQIFVISHNRPDHTGGMAWQRAGTFSLGNQQIDLGSKPLLVPTALAYPGMMPVVTSQPQKIAEGVATLGTIPFAEVWQLASKHAMLNRRSLSMSKEAEL
jgi:metal-dependent hydrolase (beta-lactamase superfamily II)